ncbi:hypothetical protein HT746_05995 [Burkholderia pyrrocinia]|uniref:hypothetical protein n=1 Tax=Burkholderia pyrrocinia TaxID=60550 RepID=UPI001576BBAE|nr:hypothetical protein [Burkholderia pyrrocinia]NTX26692.1 hypothetical protein [Burkholderia pyrrocinia]QVN23363.1 hypothetical protein JYG32_33265 [Burkholderia pyrrocinia]
MNAPHARIIIVGGSLTGLTLAIKLLAVRGIEAGSSPNCMVSAAHAIRLNKIAHIRMTIRKRFIAQFVNRLKKLFMMRDRMPLRPQRIVPVRR